VSFAAATTLNPGFEKGGVSSQLGIIGVEWSPLAMEIPEPYSDNGKLHGPLVLKEKSKINFQGPAFYIERTPFKTSLIHSPANPKAGEPFTISYSIRNESDINQALHLQVHSREEDHLMWMGPVRRNLDLAPHEETFLEGHILATIPGCHRLPTLQVSSSKFKSWVINQEGDHSNEVFVLP